ncbi:S41 family peptidase [Flavobacterium jejuense]|uniref:S41 family peptidase n=1 Tax=Flavobacterium jejuense TaxID=1544455 RepID=A0ABX0IJQ6_9FLAO|nr:S41 family peptidase [Flavobacterium jejuense]NHN24059.1 S41 family peptidase [Flavobacterium jejuense]
MKKVRINTQLSILFITLLFNVNLSKAQDNSLTKEYKKNVIQKLAQLMNDFYVFPEVAKLTEEHLKTQMLEGYFDEFKNNETFAAALTKSVQAINKDKHMRIRSNQSYTTSEKPQQSMIEEHIAGIDRSRQSNAGFKTVKILEGNVGYLDLRGFAGMETGKDIADAYMKLMSRTDAIIIDLSKNGGGSPRMVQYLCSYFFNKKLLLNSLYWREGNTTEEFWTLDEVGGHKRENVPLFIITSERTFSGAEEFSYNMQTQKRATLVGQTTGGGANPGNSIRINDNLSVFIPKGKAINPVTKTNWEGVGVIPEVATSLEDSYEKTLNFAQKAAEVYRTQRNEKFKQLFTNLNNQLNHYTVGKTDNIILENLRKCKEVSLFDEGDINNLGYDYLITYKKNKIAESILKANTILYQNSANAFDSYAELLMINGNLEASIKNYQQAVNIAIANKDRNLELFQKNLEIAGQKLKNK